MSLKLLKKHTDNFICFYKRYIQRISNNIKSHHQVFELTKVLLQMCSLWLPQQPSMIHKGASLQ